jgi:hypothetical protein
MLMQSCTARTRKTPRAMSNTAKATISRLTAAIDMDDRIGFFDVAVAS